MNQEKTVTKTNVNAISNWLDYPIKPTDHISGDPKCKLSLIRTTGAVTPVHQAMILTIEPSTFRYRFEKDESWIVLQGKVTITLGRWRSYKYGNRRYDLHFRGEKFYVGGL